MKKLLLFLSLMLFIAAPSFAQTQEQTIISGTSLPGSCNVGDVFMLTTGAGAGVNACYPANTWNAPGGIVNKTEDYIVMTGCTGNVGAAVNATMGSSGGVDFPSTADSSIVCTWAVPVAMDVTQPAKLVLDYAPAAAPGTTNNKVNIKIRYTDMNGSPSSLTTADTLTLANNTNLVFYTGTNAIIAANVLTVGDKVSFEIYRDVSVGNNAAVNLFVPSARIQYTRLP